MTTLNYQCLASRPLIFLRLTGVKLEEFASICARAAPYWEEKIESRKKCVGHRSPLHSLEDKLLALFIYYRTYITHEFIGYLVGLHNTNISRWFKKLEPLVACKVSIKKDRSLTQEEIIKILADVTEQPIQRPKKKGRRQKNYSGKKKRHTQKVEIVMESNGKITSVSHSCPGRRHDFRIRKEEKPLPRDTEKYVDLGYQGLQKLTQHVKLPFKRPKGQVLSEDQKRHNRQHASFRMKVEHKVREIKVFKILSEVYRNFGKKHHLRFNILAGVINLRHGF